MPLKCCYRDCNSTNYRRANENHNNNVSFHPFRGSNEQRAKWIAATGRVNWVPPKGSVICSNHFTGGDFAYKKGLGLECKMRTVLKRGVIPIQYGVNHVDKEMLTTEDSDCTLVTYENTCSSTSEKRILLLRDGNAEGNSRKKSHIEISSQTIENTDSTDYMDIQVLSDKEQLYSTTVQNTTASKYIQANILPSCHVNVQTCMGTLKVTGCQTDSVRVVDVGVQTDFSDFYPIRASTPCPSDVESDSTLCDDANHPTLDSTYSPSEMEQSVDEPEFSDKDPDPESSSCLNPA